MDDSWRYLIDMAIGVPVFGILCAVWMRVGDLFFWSIDRISGNPSPYRRQVTRPIDLDE